MRIITNSFRKMSSIFPQGWFPEMKHDHAMDYGWPRTVSFEMLHAMYRRNGLAKAGAKKTMLRTWETIPALWESEEPKESTVEADIRQRFEDLRLWSAFIDADERSFVGGYAGVILRLADDKPFNEPVDRVGGGLDGLVGVIPAWAGQLQVSQWDTDQASPTYGEPKMFIFHEAAVDTAGSSVNQQQKQRNLTVHPDRVIIWSQDGTVHAPSELEAGYNDLIDAEKVKGAGGEGFWKSAKGSLIIEMDKGTNLSDMARDMGVAPDKLADALNEQVDNFQKGFDKGFIGQGMKTTALAISLPQPEEFFSIPVQSFAASISMPVRELIGNQTGERASTEDQKSWSKVCMARRLRIAIPSLREFVNRLERFGILPERDWTIHWDSLLDASPDEKLTKAKGMAEINRAMSDPTLTEPEPTFSVDEIREVIGYEPQVGDGGDD